MQAGDPDPFENLPDINSPVIESGLKVSDDAGLNGDPSCRPIHNLSVSDSSDEAADDLSKISDRNPNPMERILDQDPVFNLKKKGSKKRKINESNPADQSLNNSKGVSSKKDYIPKTRSGAYALLITIYHQSNKPDYLGYMSKAELCDEAQPLSDQSFTMKNVRSEHYTAWNGMSTLLKHGLISKWSNPVKFKITEKGNELATRILNYERESVESVEESHLNLQGATSNSLNEDQYKRKKRENENTVQISSNIIKGINDRGSKFQKGLTDQGLDIEADSISNDADTQEAASSYVQNTSMINFDIGSFSMEYTMSEADFASNFENNSSGSSSIVKPISQANNLPLPLALANMYRCQMGVKKPEIDRHTPQFKLRKGSFDILLCVDNTETTGGGSGGRKTLKLETVRHLQSCNVMYDRRNLNIGDFLWIAKERVGEVEGQFMQRQPKELVLPYVVERKRLDDLWMSVKDGRYEEQKFRMKGCGLLNLFYLIEDHPGQKQFWGRAAGQGGTLVTPEAIEQAIANTAVQEGFTVKKTADQKGTIEYLTLFTRLLRDKYRNLDLTSCTQSDLSDGLIGARDTTLLTFQEFNDSSKKNKQLTVTEVFAKMLLRLKGLSVDMAQSIVKKYPTPRDLMDAYSRCDNGVEKIHLISDLPYGLEGKRKIPKTIAEALMKFWSFPSLI